MSNKGHNLIFPIIAHGTDMDSFEYKDSLISVLGEQIKAPKCVLFGPGAKHFNPANQGDRRHTESEFKRKGELANGGGKTGVAANTERAAVEFEEYLNGFKIKWDVKTKRKAIVPIVGYSRGGVTAFHIARELKKRLKEWQAAGRFPGLELEFHITALDPVIGVGKKGDLENRVIVDGVTKFTAIYYTSEDRNGYRPQERTRLIFENPDTEIDLQLMPGYHYAGDHAENRKRDDVAIAVWHIVATSLAESGVGFQQKIEQNRFKDVALPVMPVPTEDDCNSEPISLGKYSDKDEKDKNGSKELLKLYHRIKLTLPDYPAKGIDFCQSYGLDLWYGERNLPRRNYVRGSHFFINNAEEKAFAKVFPKHYQHCILKVRVPKGERAAEQALLDKERGELEAFYKEASVEFYQKEQAPKEQPKSQGKQKEPLKVKLLSEEKPSQQMTDAVKKSVDSVVKSLYEGENITVVKPSTGRWVWNGIKNLSWGVLIYGFKVLEETAIAALNGIEQLRSGTQAHFLMGLAKFLSSPVMGIINAFKNTVKPFESRHPEYPKFIPPTGRKKNKAERLAHAFVNQLLTYKRNMMLWGLLRSSHEDLAVKLETEVDRIMSEDSQADKNKPADAKAMGTDPKVDKQYKDLTNCLRGSLRYLEGEGYNYESRNADGSPYTLYSRLFDLDRNETARQKAQAAAPAAAEHKEHPHLAQPAI